jgi:putative membrane protein insertion efficiency factor
MNVMLSAPLIGLLAVYRAAVSPFLPRACRFYPSCSLYTKEAVQKYGVRTGIAFSLRRIGRCHPWHPGGYDPVK